MAKTWVLDTGTKGTGAEMVPLEKALPGPPAKATPLPRRARPRASGRRPAPESGPRERRTSRTPLPPGHVRKKTTGELGRVLAADARAGTATVRWLRRGDVSTVPLSAISRS